ncbi:hypothetical protein [Flavobacterium sp. NKUCC04_CG]|uniref:hypothetical protein n=1 Tax=Flavobacterium sp. NKUCC04_CG TaxID=2842121 RepID=UPI001C5AFB97|nr:hypothetical protein [Flavobacterium sp. NKUCC04_CG]MBW3518329.1 hypothetical protein [Flavobacterium sp. NKUCC04_CG]
MNHEFKLGEIVVLKSGSQPFTIGAIDGDTIHVVFFSDLNKKFEYGKLPYFVLDKI